MQLLCRKVLALTMASPWRWGADLTQRWWANTGTASDLGLRCVEAGAWPSEMHPEMVAVTPVRRGYREAGCVVCPGTHPAFP